MRNGIVLGTYVFPSMSFGTPATSEQIKHFKSAAAGLSGRTAGEAIVKSIPDFYKAEITVLNRYEPNLVTERLPAITYAQTASSRPCCSNERGTRPFRLCY
jgi:hypothetical protein